MRRLKVLIGAFLGTMVSISLLGCQDRTSDESRISMVKPVNPEPIHINEKSRKEHDLAATVKKDIQSMPQIYDVAVIKGEKETLVVYKVKHLHRMMMKQIEADINKKLEKNYPKESFIVSSDFKIFIEAIELKDKMKDPGYPQDKAEKQLQKIIELKKEMT
ncbi:YhcN/YlaJ family sporulation lipoprotein [Mesobacillus zeae]|uniref:Sporulation protein n=1 Tax=Mesobacillus zeae TaxID=1917180 RepID=A0A398AWR2_9BACI|nr:YhcN/YlaJ family sporulation lipoprotein [Mesobacillus zeae]RID82035.1 sporulation protein [Mesobacillus zeae]